MNLSELHFLRPVWLLALLPLIFGVWSLARQNPGTSAWRNVVDAHLLPYLLKNNDGRPARLELGLIALGGIIASIALAGPTWTFQPQPAYQAQAERVIVIDISNSMNATDVRPSRLARARFELLDLLKHYQDGQTALIAYGAEPFVVSPLTRDAKTIAEQVPQLITELLPVDGPKRTDLALAAAGRLLAQAGSHNGQIILLTDGLSQPAASLAAAQHLHQQGYRISVIGFGSTGGAPVPKAGGGFQESGAGQIHLSRLDISGLRSLATAGGGIYTTASAGDNDLKALDTIGNAHPIRGGRQSDTQAGQWRDEGPWLLLLLLPLAALAFRRGWFAPLALLMILAPTPRAEAFSWSDFWQNPDQQASQLLQQGDAKAAANRFQRPDWRSAAAYQAGRYQDALQGLAKPQAADDWYNRGNTLAQLGDYQQAIYAYDKALAKKPDDADAQYNRRLVEQLLKQQQSEQRSGEKNSSRQNLTGQSSARSGGNRQQKDSAKSDQGKGSRQASNSVNDSDQPNAATGTEAASQQKQQKSSGNDSQFSEKGGQSAKNKPANTHKGNQAKQALASAKDNPAGEKTPSHPTSATHRQSDKPGQAGNGSAQRPGIEDLLRKTHPPQPGDGSAQQVLPPRASAMSEEQQAMENQLQQVPDDPGGLLRQRFLLQHLRRIGQL